MVVNNELRSEAEGVFFCRSTNLEDKTNVLARWDSILFGRQVGPDWVRAEGGFLPVKVNDKRVLLQVFWTASVTTSASDSDRGDGEASCPDESARRQSSSPRRWEDVGRRVRVTGEAQVLKRHCVDVGMSWPRGPDGLPRTRLLSLEGEIVKRDMRDNTAKVSNGIGWVPMKALEHAGPMHEDKPEEPSECSLT